jgi:NadR type nicotinamide-nucleotide adenylyltransferase
MKRIAITGPESTGKSVLAESLAAHYHTVWSPEYARSYLTKKHGSYSQADVVHIAKQQFDQNNKISTQAQRYFFADTEALVTKIWFQFVFGKSHPVINRLFHQQQFDLYLLCDIDLPWEPDPLREHPGRREQLFNIYQQQLKDNNLPYAKVSGIGKHRLQSAINSINAFFL